MQHCVLQAWQHLVLPCLGICATFASLHLEPSTAPAAAAASAAAASAADALAVAALVADPAAAAQ